MHDPRRDDYRIEDEAPSYQGAWARVQLSRHEKRPYTLDYIQRIFSSFHELHGDRKFADDPSVIGGFALLDTRPVMVIGQQKGRTTRERLFRNYGMPKPEGYRKALRLMQLAEKFGRPVITLIDTPGAYPGIGAEERGQAEAIATNLRTMARLRVPIITSVLGEGGSGGALAIGMGDRVLMLENAIYSVISPESCSAILWKDQEHAREAAEMLHLTAPDLLQFRVIDEIVPEPPGGAQLDWDVAAANLKVAIVSNLKAVEHLGEEERCNLRFAKFRKMGEFIDA
ncbi:MAG: acetyl-CoA carboxylase carboxyltransferase subunit alpha [Acidobacteria bacterium]|nr:MAG: acetyl-CoA carboxylase carboxyltransferase subunit alpha [Acidobacteriota bacterium]